MIPPTTSIASEWIGQRSTAIEVSMIPYNVLKKFGVAALTTWDTAFWSEAIRKRCAACTFHKGKNITGWSGSFHHFEWDYITWKGTSYHLKVFFLQNVKNCLAILLPSSFPSRMLATPHFEVSSKSCAAHQLVSATTSLYFFFGRFLVLLGSTIGQSVANISSQLHCRLAVTAIRSVAVTELRRLLMQLMI